jgi:hypothetical protein
MPIHDVWPALIRLVEHSHATQGQHMQDAWSGNKHASSPLCMHNSACNLRPQHGHAFLPYCGTKLLDAAHMSRFATVARAAAEPLHCSSQPLNMQVHVCTATATDVDGSESRCSLMCKPQSLFGPLPSATVKTSLHTASASSACGPLCHHQGRSPHLAWRPSASPATLAALGALGAAHQALLHAARHVRVAHGGRHGRQRPIQRLRAAEHLLKGGAAARGARVRHQVVWIQLVEEALPCASGSELSMAASSLPSPAVNGTPMEQRTRTGMQCMHPEPKQTARRSTPYRKEHCGPAANLHRSW